MAATNHDALNWSEIARVVTIGARVQRLQAKGKRTAHLERQADEIIAKAEAREAARSK